MNIVENTSVPANRRLQLTLVHRRFGVFRYSEALQRFGINEPTRQIVTIGHLIERSFSNAAVLPYLDDDKALAVWMTSAIEEAVAHSWPPKIESLEILILRCQKHIAWNAYSDFAELLNYCCGPSAYIQAASRLRSHGLSVDIPEISALAGDFVLACLPHAVRSFNPFRGIGKEHAWLETVFYRFALKELIADRSQKSSLDLFLARPKTSGLAPWSNIRADLPESVDESRLAQIPGVLDQLSGNSRTAVEFYFGFRGREHTLSEVGRQLHCSEYVARSTLIDAITCVAAQLGVRGPLEEGEFQILQMLFVKGMDLATAVKQLGITEHQGRALVGNIGRKFADVLRGRTRTPNSYQFRQRRQRGMAAAMVAQEVVLADFDIVESLKALHDTPEMRMDSAGELYAKLRSVWTPVARVRTVVLNRPDLLAEMRTAGFPLGWLVVPDSQFERADLTADASGTREAVRKIGEKVWIVAETLFERCQADAPLGTEAFLRAHKEETIESIYRTLVGVSQILEAGSPIEARGSEVGRLRIKHEASGAVAFWEGSEDPEVIPFEDLLKEQAQALGEFDSADAKFLAAEIVDELFTYGATLPGFVLEHGRSAETLWLQRGPQTIEEQYRSLQRKPS
jgi:hypothetical protein